MRVKCFLILISKAAFCSKRRLWATAFRDDTTSNRSVVSRGRLIVLSFARDYLSTYSPVFGRDGFLGRRRKIRTSETFCYFVIFSNFHYECIAPDLTRLGTGRCMRDDNSPSRTPGHRDRTLTIILSDYCQSRAVYRRSRTAFYQTDRSLKLQQREGFDGVFEDIGLFSSS